MANSSITIINPAATSSQMTTGTATNVVATPGTIQYHPGVAKWWVYFTTNSTSMNASYGVASVTNISTGRSTINFITPYSTANYVVVATVYDNTSLVDGPRVCFNGTPLTKEQYEAHVWEKSVPDNAINARLVNDDELPADDEFRNAWIDDGKKITHDLEKVKNIQLEKLRGERDQIMLDYDNKIKTFDDVEDHKNARLLKSKRNELRDITNDLKQLNPKSLNDVKNAFPSLESYRNPDKILNAKRQAKHQNQNAAAGA